MQVGQKVWVYEARYRVAGLTEATITKVGKKYFEVDAVRGKFYIEDLRFVTEYSSNCRVYLSRHDYEDEKETKYLEDKLRSIFKVYGRTNLSLEQLRQINKIIQDAKDN